VCAAIVPVTARQPEARRRLVAEVQAHAVARLAGYKRPKQVEVVDDLPRTATGKVMRSVLAGRPPPAVTPGPAGTQYGKIGDTDPG
jgi:acyl-coenzyme A synthetase/AMP-(fatty) acid ligase